MAKVIAYSGLDMVDTGVWFGQVLEATSSEIVIANGYRTAVYQGSGFKYFAQEVVGGTLTGFQEARGGSLAHEAFGLSVPARFAYERIQDGDAQSLYTAALRGNDDIQGSAYRDRLRGYDGDDTIRGGGGDDDLYGGAGDDYLHGGSGRNLIDGGQGFDVAFYDGRLGAYTIDARNGTVHVSSAAVDDTLRSVERLAFDDATVAFDETAAYAYRLYRAAFDRAPDFDGLSYWVDEIDQGMSLLRVAAGFIDSREFRSLYGNHPSDAQFVDLLYENVLHREADSGGYRYWLGEIDDGMSWSEVLARFADSAENRGNVAAEIADGIVLAADLFA